MSNKPLTAHGDCRQAVLGSAGGCFGWTDGLHDCLADWLAADTTCCAAYRFLPACSVVVQNIALHPNTSVNVCTVGGLWQSVQVAVCSTGHGSPTTAGSLLRFCWSDCRFVASTVCVSHRAICTLVILAANNCTSCGGHQDAQHGLFCHRCALALIHTLQKW